MRKLIQEKEEDYAISYRLVDATAIQCLHCPFGSSRIVIFNESIIEPLALEPCISLIQYRKGKMIQRANEKKSRYFFSRIELDKLLSYSTTYIFIRNYFHVFDVPRRLENLTKNLFSNSRIESSNI